MANIILKNKKPMRQKKLSLTIRFMVRDVIERLVVAAFERICGGAQRGGPGANGVGVSGPLS
jgi:hypothetical protein